MLSPPPPPPPARPGADWANSLIWGDNKRILASLIAGDPSIGLEPLAGKVDLIYIDPPFASGQDFSYRVQGGDETWQKKANLIEEKAYRDTWGKGMESYLQMMHERLTLARELLSPTGSMYLHCDPTASHYLKLLIDDVFGADEFRNEIVWKRTSTVKGNATRSLPAAHDLLMFYSKSPNYTWNVEAVIAPYDLNDLDDKTKQQYKPDANGRLVSYTALTAPTQDSASSLTYEFLGVTRTWRWTKERMGRAYAAGEVVQSAPGRVPRQVRYLDEQRGKAFEDVWIDVANVHAHSLERRGYPTQKPEALLERVIKASSNEGDLVLDFFAGSGTTLAVAERLGRRWIGCDLSRYAIQVARKRMLDIDGCRPFQLLNLGRYERRHWQVNVLNGDKPPERAVAEYYRFIIALYNAEAVGGHQHLHGRKAGRMAHVGPADAPVTRDEIMAAVRECAANRIGGLDVLGWEWELGLHDTIADEAQAEGVNVRLLVIPREVMDKRAVESGGVRFHELAYLKTSLETAGRQVVVRLDEFIIPNPELVPDEVRSRIKKWSDYIDFWAVDWNYGAAGDGDTFHNEWQTYRTRSAPALILLSEPHVYEEAGTRRILVKVIDIFGNDATKLHEVALE